MRTVKMTVMALLLTMIGTGLTACFSEPSDGSLFLGAERWQS